LFESAVKLACQQVLSQVGVDLTITDQQDIYNNLSTDPRVYGFISFRTLNYLREVAIAWYTCFGKDGINSDNFRMAIDGLCGVGLKYEGGDKNRKDREAKTVNVGEHFHMALRAAANDCEKLNNNIFVEYAEYFKDWCNKDKVTTPDLVAAINKLEDLTKVKELQFIERPVEADVIDKMLTRTNEYVSGIVNTTIKNMVNMDGVDASSVKAGELGGVIQTLNSAVDVYSLMGNLTSDAGRNYSEEVRERYRNLRQYFTKSFSLMRSTLVQVKRGLPAVYEALPTLKVLTR
jgi:hypothetical protein